MAEPVEIPLVERVEGASEPLSLFAALVLWREAEASAAAARGEEMFMGKPDAWYEDLHWFCTNGHVSGRFLKSEKRGDCCLACGERVIMGPAIGEREFAPILSALKSRTLTQGEEK